MVLPVERKDLKLEKAWSLRRLRSPPELVGGPGSCDGHVRFDRIKRSGVVSGAWFGGTERRGARKINLERER